ncbi:hypothetical protein Tco_0196800 [Tanacetum coccineum]
MLDLRIVLQCLKGKVTYHGQVDSDVILTERGRHENYDDEYQRETFQNDLEDSLTSAMMLLARAITLRHYARNCPKPRVQDSRSFMEQMLLAKKDEVGVILSNEQNYFLLADDVQMEELKELSVNICMMARIQPANIHSDECPSYDSAFISEVQTPSTSYMNPLLIDNNHEQTYPEQPKIINSTIGDDQINSNIIFDDPNVEVNNGRVDYDKHVHDSYTLEQLARYAYKEAEKQ